MNIENELNPQGFDNLAQRISDSELLDIENHLAKLYLGYLNDFFDGHSFERNFEEFIKRGLYMASIHFGETKEKAGILLGIGVNKLRNRLISYFGTSRLNFYALSDIDRRLYILYKNYFEQFYADCEIADSSFAEIIDRAMYRAILHFCVGKKSKACEMLKIGNETLRQRLNVCFAGREQPFSYKKVG